MDYEFRVKYNVTLRDEEGEYDQLRETIAVIDYISAPEAPSFYDPGDPGNFEYHFELPNSDPDTFAEEHCSDHDREIIVEYMTLGNDYLTNLNFRRANGWEA